MKSMIRKALYTGIGLAEEGRARMAKVGRRLAQEAGVAEKHGEKVARHLRVRTDHAVQELRKTLDREVSRAVDALHSSLSFEGRMTVAAPARVGPRHKAARRSNRHKAAR
jgi:hypothetical protein